MWWILSKWSKIVINEMTDKLKSHNFEVVVKNGGEDNEVVMVKLEAYMVGNKVE